MSKSIRANLIIFTLAALFLAGCESPYVPFQDPTASAAANSSANAGSTTTTTTTTPTASSATVYTVTFDSQSATVEATPTTKNVTTPATTIDALPADPQKTGYNFAGWWTEKNGAGTAFTASTSVTANITVYANWTTEPVYTVAFNAQGGSSTDSQTIVNHGKVTEPTAPTYTGYIFAGWFRESSGATAWNFGTDEITGNATLYAKWNSYSYVVTFDSQGGSAVTPGTKTVASPATTIDALPANPTKAGSFFAGWWTGAGKTGTQYGESTTVAGSFTVYAAWSTDPVYTVSFDSQGGTEVSAQLISQNQKATSPENPTKNSYTLAGWYKESGCTNAWDFNVDTVDADRTLYAKWTPVTYSITWNLDGGTNDAGNPASYNIETPTITLLDASRAAYNFAGWYSDSGLTTAVTQIAIGSTGNKTLYAKWTPVSYSISYNLNGGTNNGSNPVTYTIESSTITLAAPTYVGYDFAGWFANAELTATTTGIASGSSGAKVFYAKWNEHYAITYHLDGGTNNGTNPSYYTVASATITLADPSKTGYDFAGWFSDSGLTATATAIATGSTGTKDFYAKWYDHYAITYHLDGGTNNGLNPSYYTVNTATITLRSPTKSGNAFDGWYTDSGLTSPISTIAKGSTGALDLYAKWIASYTVTFDGQYATIASSPTSKTVVTPATTVGTLPSDPSKTGYTFGGWWTATNGGGTQFLANTTVSADLTVYAKWTPISYAISYNLNGGTNNAGNPASYTIESSTVTLLAPTRTGYTFLAWYTDSSFVNQISSIPSGSTGSVAVYALWWDNASATTAKPTFSPASGTYESDQSVTLSCATAGATIYYSTDGTTWNTYTGAISVAGNGTHMLINAYAATSTQSSSFSEVTGAEYTINKVIGTPVVSVTSGSYSSDPTLTITSSTSGVQFYYTLDGSAPTTSSTPYTGQISLPSGGTVHIRVIAVKSGMISSSIDAGEYTLDTTRVSTPQFSNRGGDFTSAQSVTISCLTSGATIRYTLDGSTPSDTNGTVYTGALSISSSKTLKAVAYKAGMSVSTVQSATFNFPAPSMTGFTIVATGQFKKVCVTWTAVSGATSYNIYWAKASTVTIGSGTKVTGVNSGWVLDTLINGADYSFIVTAVNANGESSASSVATTKPHT